MIALLLLQFLRVNTFLKQQLADGVQSLSRLPISPLRSSHYVLYPFERPLHFFLPWRIHSTRAHLTAAGKKGRPCWTTILTISIHIFLYYTLF